MIINEEELRQDTIETVSDWMEISLEQAEEIVTNEMLETIIEEMYEIQCQVIRDFIN